METLNPVDTLCCVMLGNDTGRTLKTTRTSLEIIELVREHEGLTLAELDAILDESKSTLHAHLRTLVECRFLVEDGGRYQIALHPLAIYDYARHRNPAFRIARTKVHRLAELTGLEANFTVMENGRLIMIHGTLVNSAGETHPLNFRREYYMHNTAAGKAILAELPRDRVEDILDEWGLPDETDATVSTRQALYEELEATKERGYGVVDEEFADILVAAGTAVRDVNGEVIGGLSAGGPKYRVESHRLHEELAPQLLSVAEELESELQS
jgi:DNA-binding IclR family transcriptional regulator